MTTKNAVDTTLVGQTGTGEFVGSNSPSLTTPSLGAASADSLLVNAQYSLPTLDGTSGQFISTNGSGVTSFQSAPGGTITGGANLGGGTATFSGVSGADLQFNTYTSGTNINFNTVGHLTTISSTGSGMTFPYTQAYWVAQTGGSDSDLGTSIDTPFLTVQHAITAAGPTPTMIYVVDAFTNSETIATTGAGQTLYISAPGTSFAGSFAIAATDTVFISCPSLSNFTCDGSSQVNTNILTTSTFESNTCVAYVTAQVVSGMALTTNAIVFLSSESAASITNDASAVLNGTTGGTTPGLAGDNQISGNLDVQSLSFTPTTHGIVGTTAADNASAGYVGQYISSNILFGSAVTLTSGVIANVTSISLTAGDWDVTGNVFFNSTGQSLATCQGWINTTSVTKPDVALTSIYNVGPNPERVGQIGLCVPSQRINVNSTTTVYLTSQAVFSTGTNSACGTIQARRAR